MSRGLIAVLARIREIEARFRPFGSFAPVGATGRRHQPLPPQGGRLSPFEPALRRALDQPNLKEVKAVVERFAKEEGVDPALVLAVIEAESGFRSDAISPAGAMGLMQLMPDTAAALGVQNPYDPEGNIRGGVRYLAQLLWRFGRVDLALAAYNAGPATVERFGGIPPYPETQAFVARVLQAWKQYGGERP